MKTRDKCLLIAAVLITVSGCVQLTAQQSDVAGFADDASTTTATVLYCGSTKRHHYFCFRYATGLPDEFVRIPVEGIKAKGPWPKKFTRRRSQWVLLSDETLARLIQEAQQQPVTFPTVY